MARRSKKFEYESPIPEEELSWRMGSTAGRRLEERLRLAGWGKGTKSEVADQATTDPEPA